MEELRRERDEQRELAQLRREAALARSKDHERLVRIAEDIHHLVQIRMLNIFSPMEVKADELLDLLKKGEPGVENLQGKLLKVEDELLAAIEHIHRAIDAVEKILPEEEEDEQDEVVGSSLGRPG